MASSLRHKLSIKIVKSSESVWFFVLKFQFQFWTDILFYHTSIPGLDVNPFFFKVCSLSSGGVLVLVCQTYTCKLSKVKLS